MAKIETGISSFDQISGGGLPMPSAIALIGNVGSVKEIFVRELVWSFLQKGSKVLYYSISQSAEDLRNDMSRFNWDVTQYEKEGLLHIEDIFTSASEKFSKEFQKKLPSTSEMSDLKFHKELYNLNQIYAAGMKFIPIIPDSSKPRIIILDSISPIISTDTKGVFQMIHTLKFATRFTKAIGIGLMHTKIHDGKTEETIKSLADGIIEVNEVQNGVNTIYLSKYIGEYKKGPFPLEINSEGINIIPMVMLDFTTRENQINI